MYQRPRETAFYFVIAIFGEIDFAGCDPLELENFGRSSADSRQRPGNFMISPRQGKFIGNLVAGGRFDTNLPTFNGDKQNYRN
jgi:hypothetical protein